MKISFCYNRKAIISPVQKLKIAKQGKKHETNNNY